LEQDLMSQLQERIAQFRKMANDDPDNELGHFRLGQLLMENLQFDEAIGSFRRTLELSPQFSKVYQLLGNCLIKLGKNEEAIQLLTEGFAVADERGDTIPRDEMSKLLVQLGQPAPVSQRGKSGATGAEGGKKIFESVCADCWEYWLRNLSIKVINEMRLDLSTERGQEVYDQIMRETLGLA
jgi:tetratricopeptide (TPR) repeat protein